MGPILLILLILTTLALIWAAIESRRPRAVLGAGMPTPSVEGGRSSEEAMGEALVAARGYKPKEWEAMRSSVLFVHDDLSDEELARFLALFDTPEFAPEARPSLGRGEEPASESVDEPVASARGRFRDELEARGLTGRIEPLGTFYAPGPFDAYRVRERG